MRQFESESLPVDVFVYWIDLAEMERKMEVVQRRYMKGNWNIRVDLV